MAVIDSYLIPSLLDPYATGAPDAPTIAHWLTHAPRAALERCEAAFVALVRSLGAPVLSSQTLYAYPDVATRPMPDQYTPEEWRRVLMTESLSEVAFDSAEPDDVAAVKAWNGLDRAERLIVKLRWLGQPVPCREELAEIIVHWSEIAAGYVGTVAAAVLDDAEGIRIRLGLRDPIAWRAESQRPWLALEINAAHSVVAASAPVFGTRVIEGDVSDDNDSAGGPVSRPCVEIPCPGEPSPPKMHADGSVTVDGVPIRLHFGDAV